ncbi:MAG: alpha/beta hydrolase [Erysipelotrichia bacterium]|nr:alpha/beta hydrolase [Erysipelotrichia bacterium]
MKYLLLFLISLFFISCSSNIPTPKERKETALILAKQNNFQQVNIETSSFLIFSLQKKDISCQNKNLHVYIEGDGLSWINRKTISSDPTPINSTILKIINEDENECKIYLARPCQYINSNICEKKYWTSHRFSPEVLKSFDESLNILKNRYKNKDFTLIGHSGGGAIVALLSAQRDDIKRFITIAGNLDIEKWTTFHNISKLTGSLNPADFTKSLENIEQYHLIGNNDKIITKDIFLSYYSKFNNKDKISFNYVDESHNCCWEKPYKKLILLSE